MFRLLAKKIQRGFNLKKFCLLFCAALFSTWYGLFWSVDYFAALTGGLRFVDMQPMLDSTALFHQISQYDESAKKYYLWWSLFDYAWPFLTFTTMLVISSWLTGFLSSRWQGILPWLVAAAYSTVLMDWLENIGFAALVAVSPAQPLWLAKGTLFLHAAKLFFNFSFNLGFCVVLIAVGTAAARALFYKSNAAAQD